MIRQPRAIRDGYVTQAQWDSLTPLQQKHFFRTWERAKKANIDYWEFITMSRGQRASANNHREKKWTKERIAYIRDCFEREVSTTAIAKHFGCSPDVIRQQANANGIYRKTYRIKFTRVEFQYQPQTVDPTHHSNRGKKDRFYVYAYLRTDGTPYYIGKGQLGRAHQPHNRPGPKGGVMNTTPRDPNRIRFLAWGLTEDESFEWEEDLIEVLGTIELKTGCLLNFTSGGDGLRDPTPSTRRRISESAKKRGMPNSLHEARRQRANQETCEKYDIPLEDYQSWNREEQRYCLQWLRYDPTRTYEDFVEFNSLSDQEKRERAGARAAKQAMDEAAEKFGVKPEVWRSLDLNERAAVRGYLNYHPGRNGQDYLDGKYEHFFDTDEGKAHQRKAGARAAEKTQRAAALKWGMDYEDYASKSTNELNAMKAWVKRVPGRTASQYFDRESV